MMALQLLPILQVIVILCTQSTTLAYPVYGTKRYGRTSHRITAPSYEPYQTTMLRSQRYPVNYYKLYPYSQTAYPSTTDEYYYPQESYPVYYPPARTSKYEVYQAVLPYYYQDQPMSRPNYKYYYSDPMVGLQDEIQEAEREQREESQPIGHEMLYENDDGNSDAGSENLDDVNAAFLQNLIMSQMYQDEVNGDKDYFDQYPYGDYDGGYGSKWGEDEDNDSKSNIYQEDKDVKELKELAKLESNSNKKKQKIQPTKKPNQDIHWFQKNSFRNQKQKNDIEHKRADSFEVKNEIPQRMTIYSDRKPIVKPPNHSQTSTLSSVTSSSASSISEEPKRDVRGQKEEVLMRPATPVKHPFNDPTLDMMSKNEEINRKREPSVYDTIKHMLEMEKNLENKDQQAQMEEIRPVMKKRIVSSEESLIRQLTVLKKTH